MMEIERQTDVSSYIHIALNIIRNSSKWLKGCACVVVCGYVCGPLLSKQSQPELTKQCSATHLKYLSPLPALFRQAFLKKNKGCNQNINKYLKSFLGLNLILIKVWNSSEQNILFDFSIAYFICLNVFFLMLFFKIFFYNFRKKCQFKYKNQSNVKKWKCETSDIARLRHIRRNLANFIIKLYFNFKYIDKLLKVQDQNLNFQVQIFFWNDRSWQDKRF